MLTRFLILVPVLILAVLSGCVVTSDGQPSLPAVSRESLAEQVAAYELERVHTQVRAMLTRYYRDFSARDWEAFVTHFWEGATITTIWAPQGQTERRVVATSIPDFVAEAGLGPDSKAIFEETMGRTEIRVHENLAVVWAEYQARFGDPGDIAEWSGIDAFTLMKHEGMWKITSLAFSAE